MNKQSRDEKVLILRARDGDEDAFRIIVETIEKEHKGKALNSFMRVKSHLFPVEDIEQIFWSGVCRAVYKISLEDSVVNNTYRAAGGFFSYLVMHGTWEVMSKRNQALRNQIIYSCSMCRYSGKSYLMIRRMAQKVGLSKIRRKMKRVDCPECGHVLSSKTLIILDPNIGTNVVDKGAINRINSEHTADVLIKNADRFFPKVKYASRTLKLLLEYGSAGRGAIQYAAKKMGVSRFVVRRRLLKMKNRFSIGYISNDIKQKIYRT